MLQRLATPILTVVASLSVTGCLTHHYEFSTWEGDRVPLVNSSDKTVAVVFERPQIEDRYEQSADAHTFIFENVYSYFESVYRGSLQQGVKQVDFYRSAPGKEGYDFYIYPSLGIDISAGFIQKTCEIEHGITIKDGQGKAVARRKETTNRKFAVIATADESCHLALLESVEPVIYTTLTRIDVQ